ncbi:MAG: hypothetical protein KBT47_02470 [Armatimonadetes bacterium]|nr:hypothetical protein [Candidatus Hippobium faecium]
MKKIIFIIISILMSVSLFAVGEHRIDMDRVIVDDHTKIENWSKINRNKCRKVNINTWGVESRSWTDGTNTYFYVANWNKDKKNIKIPKNCVDMISGNKVSVNLTLESMDFYFLKY